MKYARPLLLAVSTLALLISACSQSDDLTAPALEPQYGTALQDFGLSVATAGTGHVYTLGSITDWDTNYSEPVLKRFDASGKELWSRKLGSACYTFSCDALGHVRTDAAGNSYALYGTRSEPGEDVIYDATLKKFSPSGALLWTQPVYGYPTYAENLSGFTAMATTAGGDTFVAYQFRQRDPEDFYNYLSSFHLVKYDAKGQKLFEKPLVTANASDYPSDAVVAGDGSLYVVGKDELAKYSSTGALVWQRALPVVPVSYIEQVAVGSGNVYVSVNTDNSFGTNGKNNRINLYKYTTSGSLAWKRTITPTNVAFMYGLSADASGNAYLTGETMDANRNQDLFARKYTPSGSVAWTYAPKLSGTYEVAHDISAADSSKVYVVGVTNGKVNGKNYGGFDAFLIRLDTAGKKVWSR